MKHLWNFLALWAGTVLTVFIAYEVLEAIKAIVASASKAFYKITVSVYFLHQLNHRAN